MNRTEAISACREKAGEKFCPLARYECRANSCAAWMEWQEKGVCGEGYEEMVWQCKLIPSHQGRETFEPGGEKA